MERLYSSHLVAEAGDNRYRMQRHSLTTLALLLVAIASPAMAAPVPILVHQGRVEASPVYPGGVAVADFDTDGTDDVAVLSRSAVTIFMPAGPDPLKAVTSVPLDGIASAQHILPGDFDGDGDTDLYVPDHVGYDADLFLNDGNGSFGSRYEYGIPGATFTAVTAGKLGTDAADDVAMLAANGDLVLVQNAPGGAWITAKYSGLPVSTDMAIADMNGDGWGDVVVSGSPAHVLLSDPDGHWSVGVLPITAVEDLDLADMDGDGAIDVVALVDPPDQVEVWRGDGHGGLSKWLERPGLVDGTGSLILTDVNADEQTDVLVCSPWSIGVYRGRGADGMREAADIFPSPGNAQYLFAAARASGRRFLATNFGNVLEMEAAAEDTTAPVSALATSLNPAGWTGDPLLLLTAADDGWGVRRIEYALGESPANLFHSAVPLAEGVHTLSFRAVDEAGNEEETQTVTFGVDRRGPTTTSDSRALYSERARITLTATDAASGVASTRWRLDAGREATGAVVRTDAPGLHRLELASIDAVGNVEASRVVSFKVTARTSTSLYPSASYVRRGSYVTLTGLVRRSMTLRGVAGRSLVFERWTGSRWTKVATARTDSTGRGRVRVRVWGRTAFRVRYPGTSVYLSSVSGSRVVRLR